MILLKKLRTYKRNKKMSSDQTNIIACVPVSMTDLNYTPPQNALQVNCEGCKELIWIGPKQQAKKSEENDIPVLCMQCVFNRMEQGGFDLNNVNDFVQTLDKSDPRDMENYENLHVGEYQYVADDYHLQKIADDLILFARKNNFPSVEDIDSALNFSRFLTFDRNLIYQIIFYFEEREGVQYANLTIAENQNKNVDPYQIELIILSFFSSEKDIMFYESPAYAIIASQKV